MQCPVSVPKNVGERHRYRSIKSCPVSSTVTQTSPGASSPVSSTVTQTSSSASQQGKPTPFIANNCYAMLACKLQLSSPCETMHSATMVSYTWICAHAMPCLKPKMTLGNGTGTGASSPGSSTVTQTSPGASSPGSSTVTQTSPGASSPVSSTVTQTSSSASQQGKPTPFIANNCYAMLACKLQLSSSRETMHSATMVSYTWICAHAMPCLKPKMTLENGTGTGASSPGSSTVTQTSPGASSPGSSTVTQTSPGASSPVSSTVTQTSSSASQQGKPTPFIANNCYAMLACKLQLSSPRETMHSATMVSYTWICAHAMPCLKPKMTLGNGTGTGASSPGSSTVTQTSPGASSPGSSTVTQTSPGASSPVSSTVTQTSSSASQQGKPTPFIANNCYAMLACKLQLSSPRETMHSATMVSYT